MHLIFATSIVPDGAPATGYEIANAAILDALIRAGVHVTVLGFTWPGKRPADPENTVVLGSVDVRTETAGKALKLQWLSTALARGLTFSSAKMRIVSADSVRARLETLEPFDGFVLNSVQMAGAFEDIFAAKPSIYVAHNVEHRSAEENAAAATGVAERLLFRREARLLEQVEARLCARARFVFTLAEDDRAALGVADASRSAALPLVTRPTPPVPQAQPRETRYDAALIGTWTWVPNRIGLDWFLRDVVPLLPASFRIAVAGQTPVGMAEQHPRVEFVGRVPDATAFVRSGKVVPLISRAGTGVQLKTIEIFEQGLPSVATARSLRGIAQVPENCVVSDDPAQFAQALVEAAAGTPRDLDGRAFYDAQRRALDAALRDGLARVGHAGRERAA